MPIDADKLAQSVFDAGKNKGVTVQVMQLPTYHGKGFEGLYNRYFKK